MTAANTAQPDIKVRPSRFLFSAQIRMMIDPKKTRRSAPCQIVSRCCFRLIAGESALLQYIQCTCMYAIWKEPLASFKRLCMIAAMFFLQDQDP